MSRVAKYKKLIALFGTTVTTHYTDGPNSGFWMGHNVKDGMENHVMITFDFSNKIEPDQEEKMMMHFFFQGEIERAYFTKKSHRLKIIFNCRSRRRVKHETT